MTTLEQTLERIEKSLARIAQALENAHPYQYTPEGDPICPRHHEPMKKRERQGDTWYSHKVTDPATGEVSYCRGYASKSSPGWNIIENEEQPRRAQPPRQAQQPRRQPSAAPVQTQNLASPARNPQPASAIQNPPDLAAAIRELKGGRQ